ncbi:MAG: hypothetical protein ACP5K9_00660 [Candidatus Micrarchaeia archaeon]
MDVKYAMLMIAVLSTTVFASNSTATLVTNSYTPPKYLSAVIGILLILAVIFIGFVFIKDIIKTIAVLIILIIVASVAYSFLTTGSLTLAGSAGLINSIISVIGDIAKLAHPVSSVINSTAAPVSTAANVT